MSGISGILEIGRRALSAHQSALNITSHNIANVNTDGYTRQKAILTATDPGSSSAGAFGAGVELLEVDRIRNEFIDTQIRTESQAFGSWSYSAGVLEQIETLIAEPSEAGLSSLFSAFWSAWQDVTDDPESAAARTVVVQSGRALAAGMNRLDGQLREMRRSMDIDLSTKVSEVNTIVHQIGTLNGQIASLEVRGERANDYRDGRDRLVDRLHTLMNITESEEQRGVYTLAVAGTSLVAGEEVFELDTRYRADNQGQVLEAIWKNDLTPVHLTGGELGALPEARDVTIPKYRDRLDTLASTLIEQVNTLHRSGYDLNGDTAQAFFLGAGLDDIAVTRAILASTEHIAASQDGAPGNSGIALAIAQLRHQSVMEEGDQTFEDHYAATIGALGVESREASRVRDNQERVIEGMETQRQALSGVSLDEELTYLVQYQHAYQAAARVVSTADELLQSLLELV